MDNSNASLADADLVDVAFEEISNFGIDEFDEDIDLEEFKEIESDPYYVSYTEAYKHLLDDCGQAGYNRLLTQEEECEYATRAQNGEKEYRDLLTLHNIRLVVSIARRYESFSYNAEMSDLVNEGICGLIKGITKFEPQRGLRLSTYVSWWIEQAITRYLESVDSIRIPVHVHAHYYKFRRFTKLFQQEHYRFPNEDECKEYCLENKLSWDWISWALKNKNLISLNKFVSPEGEEDTEFGDLIANESDGIFGNLTTCIENKELRKDLLDTMDLVLTERDKDILLRRFGVYGREETLEEIGKTYNVTRERIRQREAYALRLLRSSYRSKHLRGWLNE